MPLRLPFSDPVPAYWALLGSPDGTIWTLTTAPTDSITHLRATNSLGTTIGDLTLSLPLTIFEIGDDYIMGQREIRLESSGWWRIRWEDGK
jgi:hypothetical protein